jgi:MFS family permease
MLRGSQSDTAESPKPAAPFVIWTPFKHSAFTVVWIATVVANIGGWMYSAACSWLMLSLDPAPLMVSFVQVASSLPMFLFAIPAGALVDIVEKRRLLLGGEIASAVLSILFAGMVAFGLMTPTRLLFISFLLAATAAVTAPAWQAIVPLLVPKPDLQAAVTANSLGVNVSRAIGPALGGALIGAFGIVTPFAINALSNLGAIGALLWWREPTHANSRLPAEHLRRAIGAGLRHAMYNRPFSDTLVRAIGFFLFSSAYWALLPLVSRSQIGGGAGSYGVLLGAIGLSAVFGAVMLPWLKQWLGPGRLTVAGSLGTAVATGLFALAHNLVAGICASLIAGLCWIATLSSLNVSAQIALPDWVRGRGLAIYVTFMFGALSLGSVVWGQLAASIGLTPAMLLAAAGGVLSLPILRFWKIQSAEGLDLSPSQHWPDPKVTGDIDVESGPVMVMIRYHVAPADHARFLAAIEKAGLERRRDGAFRWRIFEDASEVGCFVETFLVASWLDHLRQHGRVTNADRALEDVVRNLDAGAGPNTTHLIAPRLHRSLRRRWE